MNTTIKDKWINEVIPAFCRGCQYGIILNYLVTSLDELGTEPGKTDLVSGIGCGGWITSNYANTNRVHTVHGRTIPAALGMKDVKPDRRIIVVSGDGDLATIGLSHLMQAARRNDDLTVICADNFLYGMTGGQASATTPHEAVTATTRQGSPYAPFDLVQMVLTAGCRMAARFPVFTAKWPVVLKTLKQVISHEGFSFMEFITPCIRHFNKLNRIATLKDMIAYLDGLIIPARQARKMNKEQKQGKLISGCFTDLGDYLGYKE